MPHEIIQQQSTQCLRNRDGGNFRHIAVSNVPDMKENYEISDSQQVNYGTRISHNFLETPLLVQIQPILQQKKTNHLKDQAIQMSATHPMTSTKSQLIIGRDKLESDAVIQRAAAEKLEKSATTLDESEKETKDALPVLSFSRTDYPATSLLFDEYAESISESVILTYDPTKAEKEKRRTQAQFRGIKVDAEYGKVEYYDGPDSLPRIKSKESCSVDEFPYACTSEGGIDSVIAMVPKKEQSSQGGKLSSFIQKHNLTKGDKFQVEFTD